MRMSVPIVAYGVFMKKKKSSLTAAKFMALGFAVAILVGSILLWLPISSADGTSVPYVDALFTATTSLCVTGLVTVPTFSTWSLFGKIVILLLIQLGGLGIVTCGTIVFVMLGKKITIKTRKLVQESYNLEHMSGMVKLVIRVVIGTLVVETIGAVLYCFSFVPQFGWPKGVWYSIFNSVSAFCNAGIDIIGPDSLRPYVTNVPVNLTTMFLIVMGGIGFVVWWDIGGRMKTLLKKEIHPKQFATKLELHTRIVLVMTALMIFAGAAVIMTLEFRNPKTIGEFSFGEKVLASLFQSVTTRTAGFETIAQSDFTDGTSMFHMLLMFVGGSPMGTAGGIKTTTIAVLFLTTIAYLRGKKNTEVFGRTLPEENIRTAIVVVVTGVIVLFTAIISLSVASAGDHLDIAYEIVSALATVGLSRGFTSTLTFAGKIVVIIVMYLGRIGPITLASAMIARSHEAHVHIERPVRRILVG